MSSEKPKNFFLIFEKRGKLSIPKQDILGPFNVKRFASLEELTKDQTFLELLKNRKHFWWITKKLDFHLMELNGERHVVFGGNLFDVEADLRQQRLPLPAKKKKSA